MIIKGVDSLSGGILDSHNDHRLAMSFAILSTIAQGEITILGAECVQKSYPNFWEVFESLGAEVKYEK
jgi:3-phosphoshikimate 1-carboxyvinyltransferase